MRVEDLSDEVVAMMSAADRAALGLREPGSLIEEAEAVGATRGRRDEAALQRTVEAWLVQQGFEKRTPENIRRGRPRRGWQVHLHATKRNPILLDLLLLRHDGRFLELELKVEGGALREEQRELVEQGASVAWSAGAAIELVRGWLGAEGSRGRH